VILYKLSFGECPSIQINEMSDNNKYVLQFEAKENEGLPLKNTD